MFAARKGNVIAQYNVINMIKEQKREILLVNLGYYYEHEIDINKDEMKAFEWYLKSAKAENNNA